MGKIKRGHNWQARQPVETTIDRSEEKKIKIDIEGVDCESYNSENALVLPSKKRPTRVKSQQAPAAKPLSKTQRKKLEKIIHKKEKKNMRAELLEKLQTVQATKDELCLFTSITDIHSGKPKRKIELEETADGHVKINTISGSEKRTMEQPVEEMDDSSSSSEEEESQDEEMESEEESEVKLEEKVDEDIATTSVETKPTEPKPAPQTNEEMERKPVVHMPLNRKPDIQVQRLKLPILGEEQVVMEAINGHPVVILCGETGSGKTTQVPQFLYEAGYAHGGAIIGVTEPRRVAAISMSKRVAQEMNLSTRVVSYQIRYEGNISPDTKIKFMTDGVLMKEVQKDFLLTKYRVIIIDEAHERSVYTDILIGLLSRIVPLRNKRGNPLKLVIMSATLRVEDFTENPQLFKVTPPVIKIDSRQFPVTIHFNKFTQPDYLGEAYKKICKIHRQLPPGGILVFVTGQQEVHTLCAKLRHTFPFVKGCSVQKKTGKHKTLSTKQTELPGIKLEDYSVLPMDEQAELQVPDVQSEGLVMSHDPDEGTLSDDEALGDDSSVVAGSRLQDEEPMLVLPMYSLLSSDKQALVFEAAPPGCRLCVVATNVAETSLTIPNMRYVIDTGKVKTKFYDKVTGVATFRVTWTSKASANQRAGRAGRTGPGHCYRLYSSAVFNDEFDKFSLPEISRRPVDDLVLQMKDMHIDKVINFPFPTPPDFKSLQAAEKLLITLGALEKPPPPRSFKDTKVTPSTKITPLGHTMACFPVAPRYGKMLSLGHQHALLPYVVAMVAALSVQEVFAEDHRAPSTDAEEEVQKQRRLKAAHVRRVWAGSGHSQLLGDLMVLLKAVGAWEYGGGSVGFCEEHGLRYKAMNEIRKLRAQLTNTVNSVIPEADLVLDPQMSPPSDLQAKLLRQILLAGLTDQVARRLPDLPKGSDADEVKKRKNAYQSLMLEDAVYIHPGSVLYKSKAQYLIYQNIDETSKLYMKGVSVIEPEWLPLFAANQCRFSTPADDPQPHYDPASGRVLCHMTSTFGPHYWTMPSVELEYPDGIERYKWFARCLLEGAVCTELKRYTKILLTAPITMIKSWSKLQPRTEALLNMLISESVDNTDKLRAVWHKNPTYLLKCYCDWLPQSSHKEIEDLWPPSVS